jgi:hypothetical protein
MKYAVELDSGAMTYIPSFVKCGLGIQKLTGGGDTYYGDLISLLSFFQTKESWGEN